MILLLVLAAWTATQDVALPDSVRAQIDAVHRDWTLARVLPEVERDIRQRTPAWPPNLILGDFDGNRQTDIAVLVQHPDAAVTGGLAVQLLAFLGNGTGFSMFVLERAAPHDSRQFLHAIREREGHAIGVEYEAIGGHAWTYRGGQWHSNPTR